MGTDVIAAKVSEILDALPPDVIRVAAVKGRTLVELKTALLVG